MNDGTPRGNDGMQGANGQNGQTVLLEKESFATMFSAVDFPGFAKNNLRTGK